MATKSIHFTVTSRLGSDACEPGALSLGTRIRRVGPGHGDYGGSRNQRGSSGSAEWGKDREFQLKWLKCFWCVWVLRRLTLHSRREHIGCYAAAIQMVLLAGRHGFHRGHGCVAVAAAIGPGPVCVPEGVDGGER